MNKIYGFIFAFLFGAGICFASPNYSYEKPAVQYNTRAAYETYANEVNETVYKKMPRSFSYIDREPQFAIKIKKDGRVDKAWIMVSSGSKGYDKKVLKKMEATEFPSFEKYVKANDLVFRYKIKKQTKIIPIPIPLWF